jgi:Flp pilus assembly protein TadB
MGRGGTGRGEVERGGSGHGDLESGDPVPTEAPTAPWAPLSIHRRRAHAARARRRQLLLVDLALGLAIALVALLVGPGLAIVALGALVVLGGCGASLLYARVVRRRRARRAGSGG